MKKIILIITCLSAFFIVGCADEKVEEPTRSKRTATTMTWVEAIDKIIEEGGSVSFKCDKGLRYRVSYPGAVNPENLCEIDALLTEKNPDWSAAVDRNYCKSEMGRLKERHNCTLSKF